MGGGGAMGKDEGGKKPLVVVRERGTNVNMRVEETTVEVGERGTNVER